MTARRKPSSVDGLRRGVAAAVPAPTQSQPAADLPPPAPGRRPRREKPKRVRFTLDLDVGQHQALKAYAQQIEADASEVMRALLRELQNDPALADRIRVSIWQQD